MGGIIASGDAGLHAMAAAEQCIKPFFPWSVDQWHPRQSRLPWSSGDQLTHAARNVECTAPVENWRTGLRTLARFARRMGWVKSLAFLFFSSFVGGPPRGRGDTFTCHWCTRRGKLTRRISYPNARRTTSSILCRPQHPAVCWTGQRGWTDKVGCTAQCSKHRDINHAQRRWPSCKQIQEWHGIVSKPVASPAENRRSVVTVGGSIA